MTPRICPERNDARASGLRRRTWTLTAATVVAGVLVTGVSYAYWTATGTGSAAVGAVSAKVVTATIPPVTDLYPGKSDNATITLTNPNPYNVQVTLNSITVTSVTGALGVCTPADVTVASGPYTPANIAVAANNGTATQSITSFVTMPLTAGNGCQNATFNIAVSYTGNQV